MPLMKEAFAQDSKITGELVDVLGNNAAVKSWATEPGEQERFRKTVAIWHRKIMDGWNGAVNSGALSSSMSAIILILPIALLIRQVFVAEAGEKTAQLTQRHLVVDVINLRQIAGRIGNHTILQRH